MNKALSTFDFNANTIRVVDRDGAPWFVGPDVCRLLGLQEHPNGGFHPHYKRLDPNELSSTHQSSLGVKGRAGVIKLISESGLYKLILRSDKPNAKPFQDWVTKVVLPAIRKDGGYVVGEEKVATGEMATAA